ncbi:hypothetical protein [Saccharothrix lopnurensis]|uniref:PE family protein n=1 Tax=Saccharothrix lopnurensis TaxID=1670621 RepID=A0ABW1P8P4_9PSEU
MAEESGLLGAVAGIGGVIGKAVGDVVAAEKRLGDAMASGPGSGQRFEVTEETVLRAGKVISGQMESLQKSYADAFDDLRVELRGSDELNQDVAMAWNDRLVGHEDSYAKNIKRYIDSLAALVDQLREAAKQYGYTEEEVEAAMGAAGATRK